MENLELLKSEFFREELERGVRDVFSAQLLAARERIYMRGQERTVYRRDGSPVQGRSGRLMAALQNPRYSLARSGEGYEVESNIPEYMRFLDMRRHGNFQIYNRQLYGILYRETRNRIAYGFGEWARERVGDAIREALGDKI